MIIIKLRLTDSPLTHAEQHAIGLSLRNDLIKSFLPELISPKFAASKNGKPYILNSAASYSVSHTDGCVICALRCNTSIISVPPRLPPVLRTDGTYLADGGTTLGEIGIDVEICSKERPEARLLAIAERYFKKDEISRLQSSKNIRYDFYDMWTAKESMIKCSGDGLSGLSCADTLNLNQKYSTYSFRIEYGARKYFASLCSELK